MVPIPLTQKEKDTLTSELVEELSALERAEDLKAEQSAQSAGEIKSHKAAYKRLGRAIHEGHVIREVKCPILYNSPKEGMKQIINPETERVLETMPMSEFEKQEDLPFGDSEKANDKKQADGAVVDEAKAKAQTAANTAKEKAVN